MNRITVNAPAKINLWLDVKEKREDGYHEIESIMQSVSLYDEITLSLNESGNISVSCTEPEIPCDERNLAYKAAKLFLYENCCINNGIDISIVKSIPVGAGLAGGSTDAAAVLIGMNRLFSCGYDEEKLCKIGEKLGADVPFCIKKGTALVHGIGEKIKYLPFWKNEYILVSIGGYSVSAKEAYAALDRSERKTKPYDIDKLISSEDHISPLYNSFEPIISETVPDVNVIKSYMYEYGAISAMMSGSGPSVFGIFGNEEDFKKAYSKLISCGFKAYMCKAVKQ